MNYWHPMLDINQWEKAATDPRVMIIDGANIRLSVRHGQLEVKDGPPAAPRTRILSRAQRETERIMILARHGTITIESQRWLAEAGIPWLTIDSNRHAVTASGGFPASDPSLLRAQCQATVTETGVRIARHVLAAKLRGHARNCRELFGDESTAVYLDSRADSMADKQTIAACTQQEGVAAARYWSAMRNAATRVKFSVPDSRIVPAHWLSSFSKRDSRVSSDNRNAADPVNAMLSYAYAVTAGIAAQDLQAARLSPVPGVWHADRTDANAFALDMTEAVRPVAERIIMEIIAEGPLNRRVFQEQVSGEIRLMPPLTHRIGSQSARLSAALSPHLTEVTRILQARTETAGPVARKLREGVSSADIIPGALWEKIRPLLPQRDRATRRDALYSERELIACLTVKYVMGLGWSQTTVGRASYNSALRRLREYESAGLWDVVRKEIEGHGHLPALTR